MSENIFEYPVLFLISRRKQKGQGIRSFKATCQKYDLSQIIDIEKREHYGALMFFKAIAIIACAVLPSHSVLFTT